MATPVSSAEVLEYVNGLTPADAENQFAFRTAESNRHSDRGTSGNETRKARETKVALGERIMAERGLDLGRLFAHMLEKITTARIALDGGPALQAADDGAWAETSDGRITDESEMTARWAEAVARMEVGRALSRRLGLVEPGGLGVWNPVDEADAHALQRAVSRRRGVEYYEPSRAQYPAMCAAKLAIERDIATQAPQTPGGLSVMLWLTRLANG